MPGGAGEAGVGAEGGAVGGCGRRLESIKPWLSICGSWLRMCVFCCSSGLWLVNLQVMGSSFNAWHTAWE